jgi:hypothetical protein
MRKQYNSFSSNERLDTLFKSKFKIINSHFFIASGIFIQNEIPYKGASNFHWCESNSIHMKFFAFFFKYIINRPLFSTMRFQVPWRTMWLLLTYIQHESQCSLQRLIWAFIQSEQYVYVWNKTILPQGQEAKSSKYYGGNKYNINTFNIIHTIRVLKHCI